MLQFFGFLVKLKLILLVGGVIIYLLTLPPERRAGRLRSVSVETLRNIGNLAEWGRESLAEDAPHPDETSYDLDPVPELPSFRRPGCVIPDDFRRQLQAEVAAMDVPALTDWWQSLRADMLDRNGDERRRQDVIKSVISLARVLPREVWQVNDQHVPTRGLAWALTEYNRSK